MQAGKVTDALASGVWDIVLPGEGPGAWARESRFTEPYVLIEGGYVVREASPLQSVEAVDALDVKIGVAKGSAYDLYLSRELRFATLERVANGNEAAEAFVKGENDVLAGVKQPLAKLVAENPGLRLMPGRFMSIEQTMGTPRDRAPAGLAALETFIAEMKASGFVARALTESGQHDAEVAP